jgi:putative peptidoglycan binding protein
MKIFVVLICSVALANVAYGAQQEQNKQQKKKQPQTVQHAPPSTTGHAAGAGAGPKKTQMGAYEGKKGQTSMGAYQGQTSKKGQTATGQYQGQTGKKGQTATGQYHGQTGKKGQTATGQYEGQKGKKGQTSTGTYQGQTGKAAKGGKVTGAGKPTEATTTTAAKTAAKGKAATGKPFKPQHFNVPKQPNTAKAPPVKFQQGKHIEGSQNWQGQQYTVFRNYKSEWHDQGWWHSHYNNIVFVFGAPYFWNAGYWFPAWGYYPNAYYAWDGPIYGYNHLPPDQVIANVQAALQQQGYYHGEVDGLIGPLTREAIAHYQGDHGLYTTSTIDQPTLQSLGMA